MSKPYLALQPSECVLVSSAAQIYSAYVASGRVEEGQEQKWLEKALNEALLLARTVDENVQADNELV